MTHDTKKERKQCDHYIGLWLNYDDTDIVTEEDVRLNVHFLKRLKGTHLNIEDYFDWRKRTDLVRFKFCPECGERLDWRRMKHDNR